MAVTAKEFITSVGTAASTYSLSAGVTAIINNVTVKNNSTAAATFQFGIVSAGGTLDAATMLYNESIPANGSSGALLVITGSIVASAGEDIVVVASEAGLACRVSGQVVS